MSPGRERITAITLDTKSIVRWSPEVEHEREVAVFDLLEANRFALRPGPKGPYELTLSLRDTVLVLEVRPAGSQETLEIKVPARALRRVIKDYFLVCESYYQAIRGAPPSRIEAIDMGRRALHNEGSELLAQVLDGKVSLDRDTARRLFTLVCLLHIRG